MNARALEDRTERTAALRALLAQPFVGADEPAYTLVRRHERELATTLQSTFGYRLEVGSTAARAAGPPTASGLHRPLRVRPASQSGRQKPVDAWTVLSDRGCVLLLLTLVALERGGAQIALQELAREVERAGADVEPPVRVQFTERGERVAFADGIDLLCAWGVLAHTSGSRESYTRREQGDDEALFTVDRRRLAMLVHDPARALEAETLDQLLDESARQSPTPEGENRARAERLARMLAEDPLLLLDDLDADDRSYFLGQRARVEDAVANATGYAIERRAEGTALITDDRAFTDVPFPTASTVKQVALLLCDVLAAAGPDGAISCHDIRRRVEALAREHGAHWGLSEPDPAQVAALTDAAIEVLKDVDLVRDDGVALRPTALAARYRAPSVRRAGDHP